MQTDVIERFDERITIAERLLMFGEASAAVGMGQRKPIV